MSRYPANVEDDVHATYPSLFIAPLDEDFGVVVPFVGVAVAVAP